MPIIHHHGCTLSKNNIYWKFKKDSLISTYRLPLSQQKSSHLVLKDFFEPQVGATLIYKSHHDGIWELRPGNNRVFYFFYQNDTYSAWKTGCAAEVHSHRTFRTPVLFYVLSVWINLEPSPDCHFSRCQSMPADVKSWTTFFTNKFEKKQKNKPYKAFSRYRTALSLVGLNCYSI